MPVCAALLPMVAGAALLLTGCATVGSDARIVYLDIGGDNDCTVTLEDDAVFALPADREALARHLRREARAGASAIVGPRPSRARPGCWDEAVSLVGAARFRRIGFLTDDRSVGRQGA